MTGVYYLFCSLTVLSAIWAQKKNNKILFALSCFFVCFIAGFRAESVGIDTYVYYAYIDWAGAGVLKNVEIGFTLLSRFLMIISHNSIEFVVFVFSSLTIVFFFLRFWTLRKIASYPLMVFLYLALYFQLSLNIMRQFFSVSIIFFASYFLENRKYTAYFISVALAALFHYGALLGLLLFVVFYWNNAENITKKAFFPFILIALVPVMLYYGNMLFAKYSGYFENANPDIGFLLFAKFALLLLFIFWNQSLFFTKDSNENIYKIVSTLYFLGICFTFLGYIYRFMDRIGLCLMIFEPVCLAIMCKKRNSSIFKIAVFALALFIMYKNYISNGNGVFPYGWIF